MLKGVQNRPAPHTAPDVSQAEAPPLYVDAPPPMAPLPGLQALRMALLRPRVPGQKAHARPGSPRSPKQSFEQALFEQAVKEQDELSQEWTPQNETQTSQNETAATASHNETSDLESHNGESQDRDGVELPKSLASDDSRAMSEQGPSTQEAQSAESAARQSDDAEHTKQTPEQASSNDPCESDPQPANTAQPSETRPDAAQAPETEKLDQTEAQAATDQPTKQAEAQSPDQGQASQGQPSDDTQVSEEQPSDQAQADEASQEQPSDQAQAHKASEGQPSDQVQADEASEGQPSDHAQAAEASEGQPSDQAQAAEASEGQPSDQVQADEASEGQPSDQAQAAERQPSDQAQAAEGQPSDHAQASDGQPAGQTKASDGQPTGQAQASEGQPAGQTKTSEGEPPEGALSDQAGHEQAQKTQSSASSGDKNAADAVSPDATPDAPSAPPNVDDASQNKSLSEGRSPHHASPDGNPAEPSEACDDAHRSPDQDSAACGRGRSNPDAAMDNPRSRGRVVKRPESDSPRIDVYTSHTLRLARPIGELVASLRNIFPPEDRTGVRRNLYDGEDLDMQSYIASTLSRKHTGEFDPRVFERREKAKRPSVAVMLVVDRSGSMQTCMDGTRDGAVTLMKALTRLRVPFGVIFYNARPELGLALGIQKDADVAGTLPHFTAGGDNDVRPAISMAEQLLDKSGKDRQLVMVITDGLEENSAQVRKEIAGFQKARKAKRKSFHVTAVGIGAECSQISDYFPDGRWVRDATDMPQTLSSMLKNELNAHRRG